MSLLTRINDAVSQAQRAVYTLGHRAIYRALKAYYTVAEIAKADVSSARESKTKSLRNPVFRLVEFYVSFMWPGPLEKALPVRMTIDGPKADKCREAIYQVLRWSNWTRKKNKAVRMFVQTGDLILKVVTAEDDSRVYHQIIDPSNVTELETDDQGIVTWIRIDVPKVRKLPTGVEQSYTYTEVWDADGMRRWDHEHGLIADLKVLGNPSEENRMGLQDAGTPGLLPFAYAPFRDIGEARGVSAAWPVLTKIDEADALASRLHSTTFRYKKPMWAIEQNLKDSEGRPLPPPALPGTDADGDSSTPDVIDLSGESMLSVNGTLRCLVPDINLSDANDIVRDQVAEIERDLPELGFSNAANAVRDGRIATETLRMILAPAEARILEARANAEDCLIQANLIALAMAQNRGLKGFAPGDIGTYESGDWKHGFEERDVWPLSESERTVIDLQAAQAAQARIDVGIPEEVAWKELGYSDEEIAGFLEAKTAKAGNQISLAQARLDQAQRAFDAGVNL